MFCRLSGRHETICTIIKKHFIEQSFNPIDEFLDYYVTQCSGCVMKNSLLCM